jgi:prevent-host-death family protein
MAQEAVAQERTDHVTVRELNQQTGEVLRRVEAGETLIVTKNGREVAVLRPAPRNRLDRMILTGRARAMGGSFRDVPRVELSRPASEILAELRAEES